MGSTALDIDIAQSGAWQVAESAHLMPYKLMLQAIYQSTGYCVVLL